MKHHKKDSFWHEIFIELKDMIIVIPAIALYYCLLQLMGISCPIRYFTGLSCPGCGMTRAFLSLFRLDFKSAFYYHPLFMLPILAVILYLLRKKLPKLLINISAFTMIIAFVIVYTYRLVFTDSDVVIFSPKDGLIHRLFSLIWQLILNIFN